MPLQLDGKLDVGALEWSLNEIVRRHASLRTTFPLSGDGPVQLVAATLQVSINVLDLEALGADARSAELSRLMRTAADRPCDLARGPLIRTHVFRLAQERHLLQIDMHHIVTDASSRRILVDELVKCYDAATAGRAPSLVDLPCQLTRRRLNGPGIGLVEPSER